MKTQHTHSLLIALLLAASLPASKAVEPVVSKLLPATAQTSFFGKATAVNEKFLLVGDSDQVNGLALGAVHVFDARTGAFLRKLRATDGAESDSFGSSISISGDLAIIGSPGSANSRGAAYVFNVNTGVQLRKFTAVDGLSQARFGTAVAINGSLTLVGAPASAVFLGSPPPPEVIEGSAYLFDVNTGSQVRQFSAADLGVSRAIGSAVALEGGLAVIGAKAHQNSSGAAVVVDLSTGEPLYTLVPSGVIDRNQFGSSIAVSGDLMIIGASGEQDRHGVVYVFDLPTGTQLRKLTPGQTVNRGGFGETTALSGNLALIGAGRENIVGNSSGTAYLMDVRTGNLVRKLIPSDAAINDNFGFSVALSGNTAVIGATGDDDRALNVGSSYVFQSLTGPLAGEVVVKKGDAGINVSNTTFSAFSSFLIDTGAQIQGTLVGAGATSTTNSGLWNQLSGSLDLIIRTGDSLAGLRAVSLTNPISGFAGAAFQMTAGGVGVTAANDKLIANDDGTTVQPLVREDDALNLVQQSTTLDHRFVYTIRLRGEGLNTIGPMVGDLRSVSSTKIAFPVTLKSKGTVAVTANNDSAVLIGDLRTNRVTDILREGGLSPIPNITFGPVAPRAAQAGASTLVHAELSGPAAQNAGLFVMHDNQKALIARKGDTAPGSGGTFNVFLGETGCEEFTVPLIGAPATTGFVRASDTLFRASITGVAANLNEGLWTDRNHTLELIAQKRTQVPVLGLGVKFLAFQRYWMLTDNKVIFQASLNGTGVNSTNDVAIFLSEGNGTLKVLMREGDLAEGTNGATIGSIQKVDVDSHAGAYVILVSLTGSTLSTSNQALYVGNACLTSPSNLPFLRLRKGTVIEPAGSAITSIAITVPENITGAGGIGNGCTVVQDGPSPLNPVSEVRVTAVLTLANNDIIAAKL